MLFLTELQGHAIKNQDLLIASGQTHIKGSESITALEEDMEFVSIVNAFPYEVKTLRIPYSLQNPH